MNTLSGYFHKKQTPTPYTISETRYVNKSLGPTVFVTVEVVYQRFP